MDDQTIRLIMYLQRFKCPTLCLPSTRCVWAYSGSWFRLTILGGAYGLNNSWGHPLLRGLDHSLNCQLALDRIGR